MRSIRKFGAAVVVAGIMAAGINLSVATLEAAKGGNGNGNSVNSICAYLNSTYATLDPNSLLAQLIAAAISAFGC